MLYNYKRTILSVTLIILSFVLIACDQSEELEESQDMHVCEHLVAGPSISMAASADYESAMDSLMRDSTYLVQYQMHIRYDVALLADSMGHYYGHVPYRPIAGEGDYILYLDQSVDVTIRNAEDASLVTPEESFDHSDDCAAVAYKGLYHLHENDTYILSFEDFHASTVGMLFPMSAEEDEDHDH